MPTRGLGFSDKLAANLDGCFAIAGMKLRPIF
jgi:hypothetical protein